MTTPRLAKLKEILDDAEIEERFSFLDGLREGGSTNMFGSSPYLTEIFGDEPQLAVKVVVAWMETFSERSPR